MAAVVYFYTEVKVLPKPSLIFLQTSYEEPELFPELVTVVTRDVKFECARDYDDPEYWGPFILNGEYAVCLHEGSEGGLHLLDGWSKQGTLLFISVIMDAGTHTQWWKRLNALADERGVKVIEHTKQKVAWALGMRRFDDAIRSLESAADIVRGDAVQASDEAMRTEKAITRAIETLRATGFRVTV